MLHKLYMYHQYMAGADPGFSFRGGGGGRKRLCARTHITSAEPSSLSAGVQGPLKGPGSSRVVLMLSRAIWALFLSILMNNWIKKNIVDPILAGHMPVAPPPPLDPPLHGQTGYEIDMQNEYYEQNKTNFSTWHITNIYTEHQKKHHFFRVTFTEIHYIKMIHKYLDTYLVNLSFYKKHI